MDAAILQIDSRIKAINNINLEIYGDKVAQKLQSIA
jgi:hypothetical protein